MKRSGGPKRKKGLQADPEKVRAFLNRGKGSLGRASAGLKRSTVPKRGKARPKVSAPPTGSEGLLRDQVWELDRGRCLNCGKRLPRHAGRKVWQVHHCIPKQSLKRYAADMAARTDYPTRAARDAAARALADHLIADPDCCALLCTPCHMNHESGGYLRVIREKLPARVIAFADRLGPWATDLLHRLHPEDQPKGGRT